MDGWRSGNDIASVAGGLGFDSRAGQIRHSKDNGSPPLRYLFGIPSCVAQALSCGDGPRSSLRRYVLGRNTASIMEI